MCPGPTVIPGLLFLLSLDLFIYNFTKLRRLTETHWWWSYAWLPGECIACYDTKWPDWKVLIIPIQWHSIPAVQGDRVSILTQCPSLQISPVSALFPKCPLMLPSVSLAAAHWAPVQDLQILVKFSDPDPTLWSVSLNFSAFSSFGGWWSCD